jgi:transcriptional regulator with XRE-family HTH domain
MKETQLNEKIRNAIKQAGYKQKEVASMLKVTQAAVSEWVTGRSAPRHGMLVRLAEVLNLPPEWFLSDQRPEAAWRKRLIAYHEESKHTKFTQVVQVYDQNEFVEKPMVPVILVQTPEYDIASESGQLQHLNFQNAIRKIMESKNITSREAMFTAVGMNIMVYPLNQEGWKRLSKDLKEENKLEDIQQ